MPDYSSHSDTLRALERAQEAESDMRDAARECHHFIDKRDGQWEPYWWEQNKNKPRYTFDQVSDQVDQVAGEMENADFSIIVKPAGGDASKDDAKLLDGMVRNIENISSAEDIYELAGRSMITGGLDGWRLEHKYLDDDSFHQDLVISYVPDWIDSVWFGPFTKPDASDAPYGFLLEAMPKEEYDEKYPKGSGMGVSDDRISNAYYNRRENILVGQFYYIEEEPRDLLLMSTGEVLEDTPENQMIMDELAEKQSIVIKRRKIKKKVVYSRLFDGQDWLSEPQKTVWNQVPLIPCMANFKLSEHKMLYRGLVEKLMDPQRVYNYAKSREIEEGALAPREKIWMTPKQMAGHTDSLKTLNTNADPVQAYNPDEKAPGVPQKTNGATVNPGLNTLSADMAEMLRKVNGQYAASLGDNPNAQSGIALKRLKDTSDTGDTKYFSALKRAIARTGRMLVDAIPVVYDTPRQVRIMNEDGSFDMANLNQVVIDQQTNTPVKINDVSKGKYDVTCTTGPTFQSKQEETVAAITEMGRVDPSIIELGGDILFSNINSPGMDQIAERKRAQIFQAGLIPFEQQTDEEKEQTIQAQNQPPPEDPMMVAAKAEAGKAEADMVLTQIKGIAMQREQDRKDFQAQEDARNKRFDQLMQLQAGVIEQVNKQAASLKTIAEALGIPAATRTGLIALERQTKDVIDAQSEVQ